MTRRSATNNRYQKGTTPKGATRKSAASVKPKREAKYTPKTTPSAKKSWLDRLKGAGASAGGSGKANRSYLRAMPDTPEYKALRRRWWIFLGVAVVLLAASLFVTSKTSTQLFHLSSSLAQSISMGLSWAALVFVAYSWWLDFKKIRPLIKAAQKKAKSAQPKSEKGN